ncbi:MAG: hypothetical protein ABI035_00720 [Gemmatimonadaceae bacterium]
MQSSRAAVSFAFTSIVALAFITQSGCRDAPTAPGPPPSQIAAAINAPGDSSAPEIVFLAPLGPKHHPRGALDTMLAPSVVICRLDSGGCGADTLAHFSSDSTADSTRRVLLNDRAFHFRWQTRDLAADTAAAYRIIVALGDTTVGFTDVKIVAADYAPLPDDTIQFAFVSQRNWLSVRFQIFVPPVALTVILEPGMHGDMSSRTYSFRRGERVSYSFGADSGYNNALVTLDQVQIPKQGRLTMNDSHVLIVSADRVADVASGDEWILHDARAMLRSRDKVASAQQLLDKLDVMPDTVNITERLRRVEMTVLKRDDDAASMESLDAALDGHSFDAGYGDGIRNDVPGNGGGGGLATSLFIPLGANATLRPAASIMTQGTAAGEPVTIAYVNGILTTPLGALFAAHHVAILARSAQWYANVPFEVKLIYNRSAIADETSAEDKCVLDLGIKGDWLGLNSLPHELAKCLNSTDPKALAMLSDYVEAGTELLSVMNRSAATRPRDVDTVAAFATRMRDEGRHLIFVMHSQGNMVVQQALTLLKTRGKYAQASDTTCIGGVALASPTSQAWPIAGRHLHGLVVDGDAILLLGKNGFPRIHTPMSDSAARATSGSVRARIVGLATAAGIRWGLRLHSVVQSYLTPDPMRGRIQDAIVSAYRGCALSQVQVSPRTLELHTGETRKFQVALLDLNGEPLDGRRGLTWESESQTDWQRAVSFSTDGTATAHYVGGTSVSARTRSISGNAGVVVDPAPLAVTAKETLSAIWAVVLMGESKTEPPAPFVIPSVAWDGGPCSENATFESNGRIGTFSKQCTADYRVTTDSFPGAAKYQASFFEKAGTASLFTVSAPGPSIRGTTAGPSATLDLLPGPILLDRITVTGLDEAGHLLATGVACVHGCIGW